MKIIVTTKNKAKWNAIEEVIAPIWSVTEFINEKFSSNIPEQPMSEEEGIQGAQNRIKNARKKYPKADYIIGMEGFVNTNQWGMFLGGCVVIEDKRGKQGIGISAKIQLPADIEKAIQNGAELGPLIQEKMNDIENTIRHQEGTNGILTNGIYTRIDEFKDATRCALAPFQSPKIYKK